jgi:hypothetical protein
MSTRHEPTLAPSHIPAPGGHYMPEVVINAPSHHAHALEPLAPYPLAPTPSPLRRAVASTVLIGAAVFLAVAALAAFERFAPVAIKPSTIVGAASGNSTFWQMSEEQAALQTRLRMVNDENVRLQRAVIEAQTQAQERIKAAESQAQQEVLAMQGNVESMTRAYSALYERGNMFAQKSAEIVQALANSRLQMASAQQGGKTAIANFSDLVGAFGLAIGDQNLASSAFQVRDAVTQQSQAELDAAMRRGLPQIDLSNWAQGMPDPAALIASGQAAVPRLPANVYRTESRTAVDTAPAATSLYRR